MRTQVLVVGAGPGRADAAMDLASRGIDVVVAETRHAGEPPSVKCNHVAARSMEIFRRLGVAAEAARRGPAARTIPNDVAFRTTATGIELCAHPHSLRARDRYTRHGRPRHLVADARAAAPHQPDLSSSRSCSRTPRRSRASRILNAHGDRRFAQDDDGVIALARDLDSGEALRIERATIWSAATAAARWCASRSAPACPARR